MYVPNLFTCLERRFHQNSFTHQVYSNIDQAVRTSTWNRELEFFASVATASWGNFFLNVVILTTCNSTHLLNKFHIYCVNPCTGRNVGTHCFFPRAVKFECFQLVLSCFNAFTHFCRKLANVNVITQLRSFLVDKFHIWSCTDPKQLIVMRLICYIWMHVPTSDLLKVEDMADKVLITEGPGRELIRWSRWCRRRKWPW